MQKNIIHCALKVPAITSGIFFIVCFVWNFYPTLQPQAHTMPTALNHFSAHQALLPYHAIYNPVTRAIWAKALTSSCIIDQNHRLPAESTSEKTPYRYSKSRTCKKMHPEVFALFQNLKAQLSITKKIFLYVMQDGFVQNDPTFDNLYGLYNPANKTIYLSPQCIKQGPAHLKATLLHELAHAQQFTQHAHTWKEFFAHQKKLALYCCEQEAESIMAQNLSCFCCLYECAMAANPWNCDTGYFTCLEYSFYIMQNLYDGNICQHHQSAWLDFTSAACNYLLKMPSMF